MGETHGYEYNLRNNPNGVEHFLHHVLKLIVQSLQGCVDAVCFLAMGCTHG
jgi:hypothetical protein